jgi:hypothetical protein
VELQKRAITLRNNPSLIAESCAACDKRLMRSLIPHPSSSTHPEQKRDSIRGSLDATLHPLHAPSLCYGSLSFTGNGLQPRDLRPQRSGQRGSHQTLNRPKWDPAGNPLQPTIGNSPLIIISQDYEYPEAGLAPDGT